MTDRLAAISWEESTIQRGVKWLRDYKDHSGLLKPAGNGLTGMLLQDSLDKDQVSYLLKAFISGSHNAAQTANRGHVFKITPKDGQPIILVGTMHDQVEFYNSKLAHKFPGLLHKHNVSRVFFEVPLWKDGEGDRVKAHWRTKNGKSSSRTEWGVVTGAGIGYRYFDIAFDGYCRDKDAVSRSGHETEAHCKASYENDAKPCSGWHDGSSQRGLPVSWITERAKKTMDEFMHLTLDGNDLGFISVGGRPGMALAFETHRDQVAMQVALAPLMELMNSMRSYGLSVEEHSMLVTGELQKRKLYTEAYRYGSREIAWLVGSESFHDRKTGINIGKQVLTDRNVEWMKRIRCIPLNESGIFERTGKHESTAIVVGMLHLYGKSGLLNLCLQEGWKVEPVENFWPEQPAPWDMRTCPLFKSFHDNLKRSLHPTKRPAWARGHPMWQ